MHGGGVRHRDRAQRAQTAEVGKLLGIKPAQ
jgi:hypothetical protein